MNPLVKLYWRIVFAGLTLYYPNDDLTLMNVGYAELNEREGLYLSGVRDVFDKYRV